MRIKDVENATGLTAKAIRLYESKGLLEVRREAESDYRDYTDEDVKRLRNIALLRQMDVPIRSIKEWTDGDRSISDLLNEVCRASEDSTLQIALRQKLAKGLLEVVPKQGEEDLAEVAKELEELQSLLNDLEQLKRQQQGHLARPVFSTLYAMGPVGMTLFWMQDGKTDLMFYGFIVSLVMVVIAAFSWANYLKAPKSDRSCSGCLGSLLIAVATIAAMIFLLLGLTSVQTALFVPEESLIMVFRAPWSYLIFLIEVEIIAGYFILRGGVKWKAKPLLCSIAILLVVNALLLYGCVTGVSVASENGITRYSFFDPSGREYSYDDIVRVEAGFHGKILGIPVRNTGEFYYKITYSDGTTENWGDCSSEMPGEDTWEWMLRLDEAVMATGAEKISDESNAEFCDMDPYYVDILLRVIRNR